MLIIRYKKVYMLSRKIMKEFFSKIILIFKDFLGKILSPFSLFIKFLLKFYSSFFIYFNNHKEFVIIITYSLWLLLQLFFLYVSFGIEWITFISIKFSLVLLVILFFLSFISIPILFIFFLFLWIVIFFWVIWIAIILIFIIFFIDKIFPKKFKNQNTYIENNPWKVYIGSIIIIIIMFWLIYIWQFSIQKPIELLTEKQWKIMGELLFYNQDYYFINSCNEKVIIPSNQVISTHFLCLLKDCSKERQSFINQNYKNYCSNLMNK